MTELSKNCLYWMENIGEFSPTNNPKDMAIKGSTYDHDDCMLYKTTWHPVDLRELAAACQEMADFLEKRAKDETERSKQP